MSGIPSFEQSIGYSCKGRLSYSVYRLDNFIFACYSLYLHAVPPMITIVGVFAK